MNRETQTSSANRPVYALPTRYEGPVDVQRDASMTTPDGITLRADIYRPAGVSEALPTLLQRTPYNKSWYGELGEAYARAGYIAIFQDVRGQHASDGVWDPYIHEALDGKAAVEWAAELPGANGSVGMAGTSYQAYCAYAAAAEQPRGLEALALGVAPFDPYHDWLYPGGVLSLAFVTSWLLKNVAFTAAERLPDADAVRAAMNSAYDAERWIETVSYLPVRSIPSLQPEREDVAPYYRRWLDRHSRQHDYWDQISLDRRAAQITVPVFHAAGWYDRFVAAGIRAHSLLANPANELVIGPWGHNRWRRDFNDVDFGPDAEFSFPGAVISWFDTHLHPERKEAQSTAEPDGGPLARSSSVRAFIMGSGEWIASDSWPPKEVQSLRLRLTSDGRAAEIGGTLAAPWGGDDTPSDEAPSDTWHDDPNHPVPAFGGQSCCYPPQAPVGPEDQREVELRPDVLTFATQPLRDRLRLAGNVSLHAFLSSTAPHTHLTARLVDVAENGRAINLTEGAVSIRLTEDGSPTPVTIDLLPTAYELKPGHRLQIDISSTSFPTFVRPSNTVTPAEEAERLSAADHTLHHDATSPSALVVDVFTD